MMKVLLRRGLVPGMLALSVLANVFGGCGAADSLDDDDWTMSPSSESAQYGDDDDGTYGDDDGVDTTPTPTLPPESADSFYRTEPAGGDVYVFVANPDRDTVTKIDGTTQTVYTLDVGVNPTQVFVGPDDPRKALVLNAGDPSLSIVDTRTDEIQTLSIHPDTNFMAASTDGRYAITYYDPRVEDASKDINGVRSFSSISVVYTGDPTSDPTTTPMAVALNPRGATFVSATDQAIVLCDNAIAVVNLSAEPTARVIDLTEDIDETLDVVELRVSPDGRHVFVRLAQVAQLVVVDLQAQSSEDETMRIDLAEVPSDMEFMGSRLVLVDRASRRLVLFDGEDPTAAPEYVDLPENQLVGSIAVAPDNRRAVLYTTLTAADIHGTSEQGTPLNRFSLWDIESGDITIKNLVKPVEAVAIGSFEQIPVVTFLHDGDADSNVDAFAYEEAFSEYYLDTDLVVPTLLEQPVRAIAESSDGLHQFMILENSLDVIVVDYQTGQAYSVPVQSQPVFLGALTATSLGYVSQEHELGRISFIDPSTLDVTTITGFELNAQP